MKDTYIIEICKLNRLFNLPPIITSKKFYDKKKAINYIIKHQDDPNKFVWSIFENGKEVNYL